MSHIIEAHKLARQIIDNPGNEEIVKNTALKLHETLAIEIKNTNAIETVLSNLGGSLTDLMDILDDIKARNAKLDNKEEHF